LLLFVFTANAHSFASRSRDAGLQADAFVESERALKICASDGSGGTARCEGAVVFVNEVEKLPEKITAPKSSACVTRIVLFQGAQRAVQYCATESSKENPAEGVKK